MNRCRYVFFPWEKYVEESPGSAGHDAG